MRRHGLDAYIRIPHGDNTEAAGERTARRILGSGQLPTAVVAFDDQSAIGVLAALARADVPAPPELLQPDHRQPERPGTRHTATAD